MPPRRGWGGLEALVSDLFPPPPGAYPAPPEAAAPCHALSPIAAGGGGHSSEAAEFQRAFEEQHGAALEFYNSVVAEASGSSDVFPPPVRETAAVQSVRICAQCRTDASGLDRFCRQCGTPLHPAPSAAGRAVLSPPRFPGAGDLSRSSGLLAGTPLSGSGPPPPDVGGARATGRHVRRVPEPKIPPPPQDLVPRPRGHDGEGEAQGRFEIDVVRRLMREREGDVHSRREKEEALVRQERERLEPSQGGRQARRRPPEADRGKRRGREPPPHLLPADKELRAWFLSQRQRAGVARRSRSAPGTPAQNLQRDSAEDLSGEGRGEAVISEERLTTVPRSARPQGGRELHIDSSILSGSSRLPNAKERLQQSYNEEPCLRSGYFSPGNLRGCGQFNRTPRFGDLGVRDPGVAFYFLDDAVQEEIRNCKRHRRSRSEGRRSQRVMIQRGLPNRNITSRWGLRSTGGVASPGPGSYDPLWAKVTARNMF
eukprot:Hpha_TRINITY_DN16084_c1_g1::TRINITY_DN16084_c1_g1_i2::g.120573::m.120573